MKNRIWLIVVAILFSGACAGPYTVAVVVRHAEKESFGSDPGLTTAGLQRAEALRDRLGGLTISGVYSTDTQRTRQTAQPLADLMGVPVTIYSSEALVASTVTTDHVGEAVLIVGHSNTLGNIVTALGADLPIELPQPINLDDFDNMVIVIINGNGEASAVHENYGAPSP